MADQSARGLVLRPKWLIDGRASLPLTGHEVIIEGSGIIAVQPVGTSRPLAGAVILDLPESTVLPGLIDCHAHYTIDARLEVADGVAHGAVDPPEHAVLVGARNARIALHSGVTTARSAGAARGLDIALAAAIECGDVPGPRLLPAGRAVTITGGHGQHFGIEVDSIPEMRRAVRAIARDGAHVIKLIASEAAMLTTSLAGVLEFTLEEMTAIVAEAHRLHRRVLAHAQSAEAVTAAAAAGVDSVEHAFLADRAALQAVRASGAFLTPTLAVTDVYSRLPGQPYAQRLRQAEISRLHRASCEIAISLGIPMVTGSDCGVRGVFPDMIPLEVRLLHEHGLSALDAIRAASGSAAQLLGLGAETGTIEAGKLADILVVDGDLAGDLRRLEHPTHVFQAGRLAYPIGPKDQGSCE